MLIANREPSERTFVCYRTFVRVWAKNRTFVRVEHLYV
jgi:hypothetical protein